MKAPVQQYIGTTAEWRSVNPRPYDGTLCIEELPDGRRLLKIGNGRDRWNGLEYVDGTYIRGLPELLDAEKTARIAKDQDLQHSVWALSTRIDGIEGKGGYLEPHDFGTDTPAQEALTEYALDQLGLTDPHEIFSSTRVKNIYNGHAWMLVNNSHTYPPVFEWVDDGLETVGKATNASLGVVKGSTEFAKVSIDENGEMTANGVSEMDPPGTVKTYFIRDPYILTQKRVIPLQGDVLYIPDYAELAANTYVGDALNAVADGFYKTVDPQGTTRNVGGEYFVLPDLQGLFLRAAGQNSKHMMANSAPYNGGEIGEFIQDAMQNATGYFSGNGLFWSGQSASGVFSVNTGGYLRSEYSTIDGPGSVDFSLSRVARTAAETRPASLSAVIGIKF
jgi:hypothetical protein